ncbi:hypothetical protein BH09SUM1_BH09SUM1_10840 [soil metagenome]
MGSGLILPEYTPRGCLLRVVVVGGVIGLLAMIKVPGFLEAQTRSKDARTKSDIRVLKQKLIAYRTDYGDFPPLHLLAGMTYRDDEKTPIIEVSLFKAAHVKAIYNPYDAETTSSSKQEKQWSPLERTPITIADFTSVDPFTRTGPIACFYAGDRFVFYSPGFDGVYDFSGEDGWTNAVKRDPLVLVPITYDATNGTYSHGDIIVTDVYSEPKKRP